MIKALIVGFLSLPILFLTSGLVLLGASYLFDFAPGSDLTRGFWYGLTIGLGIAASVFVYYTEEKV